MTGCWRRRIEIHLAITQPYCSAATCWYTSSEKRCQQGGKNRQVFHRSSSLPNPHPRVFEAPKRAFFAISVYLSRCFRPVWKSSSSNIPIPLPGPIFSVGYVQFPGSMSSTGVLLLCSVPAANPVLLIRFASGFPSPAQHSGLHGSHLHLGPVSQ